MKPNLNVRWFFRKRYDFHFSIEKVFNGLKPYMEKQIQLTSHTLSFPSLGIVPRLHGLKEAIKFQSEINHITGDVHFLALGLPRKSSLLTIHDLGMVRHPNPVLRMFLWLIWVWIPVRRLNYITAISEETKREIVRFTKCPPSKVTVIPNYVDPEIKSVKKEFNAKNPEFLHIGIAPNKNLERTINALSKIPCVLHIVGKIDTHIKGCLVAHNVAYQNHYQVSDQQLRELYVRCDGLLFCSTLEGFGMPILESQATGRVVITSNCSSMPEVAGDGAYFVDPFDVLSIRQGINEVIHNSELRENLIRNGLENVKMYTVQRTADLYLKLYCQISNNLNKSSKL